MRMEEGQALSSVPTMIRMLQLVAIGVWALKIQLKDAARGKGMLYADFLIGDGGRPPSQSVQSKLYKRYPKDVGQIAKRLDSRFRRGRKFSIPKELSFRISDCA